MRPVVVPASGGSDGQPPRFMFKPEVTALTNRSFPTLWKWMRAGQFPLSLDVGGKTAWYASEVNDWIANRPRSQFKSVACDVHD